MNTIKRIDPRRPFTITADGLRRITLGVAGVAGAMDFAAAGMAHREQPKPRRTIAASQHVMLVAAHADRGALDEHARQTLAAAALIADATTEVVLLVFGEFTGDAAALGADKLIELPMFDRRRFAPVDELNALAACVAAYAPVHVFLPDNATGDGDLGRRYAAAANASVATHVVEIDASHVAAYVRANTAFASRALPEVILLAPNAVDPKLPFVGAGERVAWRFDGESASSGSNVRDLGIEEMDAAQLALEEADFIVSAGNGVSDVPAFERLAATLGAAIGASRVAVDDGKFTRDKQIGATGKTVEASVYIAFGISGAVQHLQGIKDCRHVIAVNLDASAPIAKRANLTVIADAQETIAALNDAAAAARSARGTGAALLNSKAAAEGALA
ncbi:electron transfer flavoprotein subunit alpha/FixB family protein [Paraburkholderia phenoliruptrix]|uniref:Electron transfer flavoprotein alpha subunit n=2 Tax=Paraburkholderia phenoliruptrix TaxID=252970 RepID=K0E255_9BURK|nr:electron transfer flavoprotein subunit alpha/FixB family protein [Paraburkholderia phenoliruptrix]AFT89799.1 electron transfer flavoprotein alpha subunit [Paraburkholderia phenoliruptrix BR3459a]MDR6423714.1 electron transfer flavoprotein alpha subunit [Paraburkholderia phenoliruptrix]CAB4046402.1 Protein FixB [Paraburkholderia phenoliruptrix]